MTDDDAATGFEFGVVVDQSHEHERSSGIRRKLVADGSSTADADAFGGDPSDAPGGDSPDAPGGDSSDAAAERAEATTTHRRSEQIANRSPEQLTSFEQLGAALSYYDTVQLSEFVARAEPDPERPPIADAVLPWVRRLVNR